MPPPPSSPFSQRNLSILSHLQNHTQAPKRVTKGLSKGKLKANESNQTCLAQWFTPAAVAALLWPKMHVSHAAAENKPLPKRATKASPTTPAFLADPKANCHKKFKRSSELINSKAIKQWHNKRPKTATDFVSEIRSVTHPDDPTEILEVGIHERQEQCLFLLDRCVPNALANFVGARAPVCGTFRDDVSSRPCRSSIACEMM